MLKRIDEQRLIDAAADPAFLDSLTRVLAAFDAYHAEPPFKQNSGGFRPDDLVAYFCAEFGVHESLPIYSGGLGILAGDHCKAASDFQLPFIAVGLLYRQGYFVQTIDGEGRQRAEYHDSDFDDLPIAPVRRERRLRAARSRSSFPGARSWSRCGRRRSATSRCTCSTPTCRRTASATATSRTGSTAATASRASSRNSCSASAARARSPRSATSPRCGTSTRATPRSWCSSASAA